VSAGAKMSGAKGFLKNHLLASLVPRQTKAQTKRNIATRDVSFFICQAALTN
jgi:hypothetical protein